MRPWPPNGRGIRPGCSKRQSDKRWLDRLIDRVGRWQATGEKDEDLASGTEREEFQSLAQARPTWLAPAEHRFVEASADAYHAEQTRGESAAPGTP